MTKRISAAKEKNRNRRCTSILCRYPLTSYCRYVSLDRDAGSRKFDVVMVWKLGRLGCSFELAADIEAGGQRTRARVWNSDNDRVLSSYRYRHKEIGMSGIRLARIVGTAGAVAFPLVTVMAQNQPPAPSPSPTSPPAATQQQTTASPTTPAEKKAAAAGGNLVGLTAKSSDGTHLGTVHTVITNPGGKTAIGV